MLIDLDPPLTGPFAGPIARITIPSWMARGVTREDQPVSLVRDGDVSRFQLGDQRFVYDRWGLASTT